MACALAIGVAVGPCAGGHAMVAIGAGGAGTAGAGAAAALLAPQRGFVAVSGDHFTLDGNPFVMKGFNYTPRNAYFGPMTGWDMADVDRELGLAEALGANTVRIFLDYGFSTGSAAGSAAPETSCHLTADYRKALESFLDLAQAHHLRVVVTLFENVPAWAFIDRAHRASARVYLGEVVWPLAHDPRIAAWDILGAGELVATRLNVDLSKVLEFYRDMAWRLRTLDHCHPITAGIGHLDRAPLTQEFVDFISFHYYEDQGLLGSRIERLKSDLKHPMPIVAEELGHASAGGPAASPAAQTVTCGAYLAEVLEEKHLAGALLWILADANASHSPAASVADQPQQFGFLDAGLLLKPAARIARRYFEGGFSPEDEIRFRFNRIRRPDERDSRLLGVAFHTVRFLSDTGLTLRLLRFGSPQTDEIEGQGWYAPETWGQWAGGDDREAAIHLPLPPGTRKIALRVHSADQGTELEVLVGGNRAGRIRIDPTPWEYVLTLP